jgi:hypothetical protein
MDQAMDPQKAVVLARKLGLSLDLAPIADDRVGSERKLVNVDVDESPDIDVVADGHFLGVNERKRRDPNISPDTMAAKAIEKASGSRRQEKT